LKQKIVFTSFALYVIYGVADFCVCIEAEDHEVSC
jgi:hypothetical protein